MQIDIPRLDAFIARGAIRQGLWGDGQNRACLMSAVVTGATSANDCAAAGWPMWLAELSVWLFDQFPPEAAIERGRRLVVAIRDADDRGIDWDRVYRDLRLRAVLPIAMDAIGTGDEPWRIKCRTVVQWSIDRDGKAAWAAEAAEEAVEAAAASSAAAAVWAAGAPAAAERDRIEETLLEIIQDSRGKCVR